MKHLYEQEVLLSDPGLQDEISFWEEQFKGEWELSEIRAEANENEMGFREIRFELEAKAAQRLHEICRGSAQAEYIVFLSIVSVLVSRYTALPDAAFSVPLMTHDPDQINDYLLLHTEIDPTDTLKSLLKRVTANIKELYAHQNAPLLALLKRNGRISSSEYVMKICVCSELLQDKGIFEKHGCGVGFSILTKDHNTTAGITYRKDLYPQSMMDTMADVLQDLCCEMIMHPDQRVKDLRLLGDEKITDSMFWGEQFQYEPVGFLQKFREHVQAHPEKNALIDDTCSYTYEKLDRFSNQIAHFVKNYASGQTEERVGILIENSVLQAAAVLGVMKSGCVYVPIDVKLPFDRIRVMLEDASISVVLTTSRYLDMVNKLQWECSTFRTYACLDRDDLYELEEIHSNPLMNKNIWNIVARSAQDSIGQGGWTSSYTGELFSEQEMNEYSENTVRKLIPYLTKDTRVLEIGCASGLTMFRIAPYVCYYYGTDLSEETIRKNLEYIEQEKISNIGLEAVPADLIGQIAQKDFDIVIINSVIQCFNGYNYLRKVLKQAVSRMKPKGILYLGDLMDQDRKAALIDSLKAYQKIDPSAKTDWSEELFISADFLRDLRFEMPVITQVDTSDKYYTIENELTMFRFDAILHIDQNNTSIPAGTKTRNQFGIGEILSEDPMAPETLPELDATAYMIYTSGTTGLPKGVMLSHRSLENLCVYSREAFAMHEDNRMTRYANFAFDASVWELLPSLYAGGTVFVLPDSLRYDMKRLSAFFADHQITHSFLPTQVAEQFMELDHTSLQCLLVGGDKLTNIHRVPYRVFNNYGPAENTVVSTTYRIRGDEQIIPIGRPIFNTGVIVTDCFGHLLPMGAVGELCCLGRGVAKGYLNNETEMKKRFVRWNSSDMICYKTGDRGRYLSDGNLEFLGRIDRQVKIRGYRIEMEEIPSTLQKSGYVKDIVVKALEDQTHNTYLAAYYVLKESCRDMDAELLKAYLLEHLPHYMVPEVWVKMDEIPLTANGKVNYQALPRPEVTRKLSQDKPRNEEEAYLCAVWKKILEREDIGIYDNFFDLGGNSLKAIMSISEMSDHCDLEIGDLFLYQTISELAAFLKKEGKIYGA
ncbi:AMP-binding protein [Ruminococcus albus]|uniref:AMP-dependent synthetase and ligase n=1 Tax=Ruminococcus albus (strain ATCC 27210 / DSM 20455 / JCM 14654 / NCDO 2250 / 7) TaxID=697329 RepID=E6UAS6_RUMA7|nr:AMP-binding protein [Ruminococcus albus]ADU21405.1 AMP-dependent synthetase and ligase [Ruminococcus albus 7 = DSM 20455]